MMVIKVMRRRMVQSADKGALVEVRQRPAPLVIVAALLVAGLLVAVLGLWLVPRSLARLVVPAAIGTSVALPGGSVRVDRLAVVAATPATALIRSRIGLDRSLTGGDVTPPGFRRIVVDVSLSAVDQAGVPYSADRFWLSGSGLRPTGPHRHQLGAGRLIAGQTLNGQLVFQVPTEATGLVLNISGGERPIALPLAASLEE